MYQCQLVRDNSLRGGCRPASLTTITMLSQKETTTQDCGSGLQIMWRLAEAGHFHVKSFMTLEEPDAASKFVYTGEL
jgi:hypothetical protein